MTINRVWAMPNSRTFSIKPIRELIARYIQQANAVIVDPFANGNHIGRDCGAKEITNDLDPQYDTDAHMDATEFLRSLPDASVNMVLYDPPYSARQVSEVYKKFGRTVNMQTTQASYWGDQKKEIQRVLKPGGIVVTCGWNSGGVGEKYGMEILEILLVPHGGWHNDTIVTVEQKNVHQISFDDISAARKET